MRKLRDSEIAVLKGNGNVASDWGRISVGEEFSPSKIHNCHFLGQIVIDACADLYNSRIEDCTIGRNCKIYDLRYLKGYTIGENCTLFDIHELSCDEELRTINVMNEAGRREILPVSGMNISDAYLWAKYRGDGLLLEKLYSFSLKESSSGYRIGPYAVLKGCTRLHNVNVLSDKDEPSFIGENVILNNGVVGYGCRVESGAFADGFILGTNCHLKMYARLYDVVLGDNSTIACCEVGNSLIFPAHEQHHNNSFLIAGCIGGQSNVAAGATLGSNHNSRSADGELLAGRGFWPGLCVSVKHSSKFASYCLLAKGAYPAELNIRLPFCLVSNNEKEGRLEMMPAYWWMYNMYALARNDSKFRKRDKRVHKTQNIEFGCFAPDSMQEVLEAVLNYEDWEKGCEHGKRPVLILKKEAALEAYKEILLHYAAQSIPEGFDLSKACDIAWVNLGGQLVRKDNLAEMIEDIRKGRLQSWKEVHTRLNELWEAYPEAKAAHAAACVKAVFPGMSLGEIHAKGREIAGKIESLKISSREKDFENPFRLATFDSREEMESVYEIS